MSVGVEDINQLKILALTIIVGLLWQIIVGIAKWWSKKSDKSDEDMKKFMKETTEALHFLRGKANETQIMLIHMQEKKADIKHVHDIVRTELDYADKLKRK